LKNNHYEIRLFCGVWDNELVIKAAFFAETVGKEPFINVAVFHHISKHAWEPLPTPTAPRAVWLAVWARLRRILHQTVNSYVHGIVSCCATYSKSLNPDFTLYPIPLSGKFRFFSLFLSSFLFLFLFLSFSFLSFSFLSGLLSFFFLSNLL
jgi:hypothetical protein